MQPFPRALYTALRDPHDPDAAAPLMAAFLAELPDAAATSADVATAVTKVIGPDDRQLSKIMVALWRSPDPLVKSVAAQCIGPLAALDLKRALRFLQKAEKRLGDAASCDALAAACAPLVTDKPELWMREAQNRLASNRPLVRRLGLGMLRPLAKPDTPTTEAVRRVLESCARETDADVVPLRDALCEAVQASGRPTGST